MGIKVQFNPSTGKASYTAGTGKVQVIDSTPPAGNDCNTCWGDGKAYGPLPTPSELKLVISGVQKGDLWVSGDGDQENGTFTISQSNSPPLACFFGKAPTPQLSIPVDSGIGLITAKTSTGTTYFLQTVETVGICWSTISNNFNNPATTKFYGGTMTLSEI